MRIDELTKITTLVTHYNREFVIATNGKHYFAIDTNYITDGRLNTPLNGLNTFMHEDINVCKERANENAYFHYLLGQGHTKASAFSIVHDIPVEMTEMLYK